MHISVQFGAGDAQTPQERERVHESGPETGTFYVSRYVQVEPVNHGDGTYDFTEAYLETLRQFMAEEPRLAEGKAFKVIINS